jgi:hypothetical protein
MDRMTARRGAPQRIRDTLPAIDLTCCPLGDAVAGSLDSRRISHLHHAVVAGIATATGGTLEEFAIGDPRVLPCRVRFREPAGAGAPA